ncbi:zinc ribbon domain-containing protein [Phreatobacter oligotrophus]|uniref:zinc ribbon domain-containing protein n=1 Tax=Phreatobacter oligotrophus TaxID=1122261 RepID=UPI001B882A4C
MAPGETRRQLEYKMQRAGGQLIVVPAPYTSQQCSCCGGTTQENRFIGRSVLLCLLRLRRLRRRQRCAEHPRQGSIDPWRKRRTSGDGL